MADTGAKRVNSSLMRHAWPGEAPHWTRSRGRVRASCKGGFISLSSRRRRSTPGSSDHVRAETTGGLPSQNPVPMPAIRASAVAANKRHQAGSGSRREDAEVAVVPDLVVADGVVASAAAIFRRLANAASASASAATRKACAALALRSASRRALAARAASASRSLRRKASRVAS